MSASKGGGEGGSGKDDSGDRDGGEGSKRESNKEEAVGEITGPDIRVTRSRSRSSSEVNQTASGQPVTEEIGGNIENVVFHLRRFRRNSGRNYRSRSADDEDGNNEHVENIEDLSEIEPASTETDRQHWGLSSSSSSDSSISNGSIDNDIRNKDVDENAPTPKVLLKPKPKHKWFVIKEVVNRQKGTGSRYQGSELFQRRCYGSLHVVQRLELMYKLEEHKGCVNNLHFNQSGSMLASASDDKKIVLWDWACGKCVLSYDSGHSSNVFQAKFLPLTGDCHIVSCGRDGQVRLALLSNTGVCKSTRLIGSHSRPTHKLATHPATPHVFLSAGEDALVLNHDLRAIRSSRLMYVKEGGQKVGLYSIHSNPVNCHEFCVTGEDHFIRLYDRRRISNAPLIKFCPQHLRNSDVFLHVTCAVFNYNGTEILGTFNDDDIYLFDTRLSEDADYVHKYEGHRNSVTVKSVNFFGPRSEFIVSGSDCGNIYFWDKHSESIVQWMRGDEDGVVNCLEPHPQIPVIATSGLDSDIKIWVPSCEEEPVMDGLKRAVILNQRSRDESHGRRSDPFDGQMRWLWRQIQRFERRRNITTSSPIHHETDAPPAPSQETAENTNFSSSSEEEEEEDGATDPFRPQCSPS